MTMVNVNRSPCDLLRETFLAIAKRGNNQNRADLIRGLYFYFEPTKDGDSYLALICEATHDELTKSYCDHLAFSLHVLKRDWKIVNPRLLDTLRSKTSRLLRDLNKLDYHALKLVEFVCGSDLPKYFELIEERIEAAKTALALGKPRRDFAVVPYDGILSIRNATTTQAQFNKFLEKIIYWNSRDSIGRYDVRHLLKPIADIGMRVRNRCLGCGSRVNLLLLPNNPSRMLFR